MPKGYWIGSGHFLKGIGKPIRNAQVTMILAGQMFLLAGSLTCAENTGKRGCRPIGEKTESPCGFWQQQCKFHPFSLKRYVSVYFYLKNRRSTVKVQKPSAASLLNNFLQIIPLLARLKLVQSRFQRQLSERMYRENIDFAGYCDLRDIVYRAMCTRYSA